MKYSELLKKKKRYFFLLSIFLVTLIGLFFAKETFTIRSVSVEGVDHIMGVDSLSGKLLFLVSEKQVEEEIYKKNPLLRDIAVIKKYPNLIYITAKKSTILAALKATDGYFYLTQERRIAAKSRKLSFNGAIINSFEHIYLRSYSVGEAIISKDVIYSLFFTSKMADLGIKIARVDILGFDVLVFKESDKTYYIKLSKTKEEQYDDLKLLVNHFAIDGQEYSSIDLRFDKPIIRFKER